MLSYVFRSFFATISVFHWNPGGTLRLPAYSKGNLIRGGFGSTFRRVSKNIPMRRELKGHVTKENGVKIFANMIGVKIFVILLKRMKCESGWGSKGC